MTEKVGVVGSGTMGTGIAQVLAAAGNHVVLLDVAIERVQRAIASIESILMKQVAKGKIAEETVRETVANISPTTDYQDLATCTIVIEAVFE
ncbi:MAG TPA: 3-hydroxyacyl-CoA dehydrogenase NAD-binding domain-containing protein, partial [Thermomicrobiales bacterium]|nr:3-hydroxyacyl-CoA dehydrogenase NAD-binding domain-containing protein [Thermomicrobiales bacterium]